MKTAIYARDSLDRDLTKVTTAYQLEHLHKLCRQRGWDDPVEYIDRNISATAKVTASGKRRAIRPAFDDLCDDIAGGVIGKLAVWDLDRLYREPRELEDFIDLAERHHVELANVGGDVDLSTPSGRMFARMKGTVAKYETEQKGMRQKAANEQRAKNGKAWNVRVFGYNGDKIVKREADAIVKACKDLIDGASLHGIAQDWNQRGIKTVKGVGWNGTSVRQVLSRPRNAGLQVYGVHEARHAGTGQSIKERISTAIMAGVKTPWPAIIDRDTFDAVLTVLSDPTRHTGKRRARVYVLSGLAYCGLCGRKMGTAARKTKTGAKRYVYQCKNFGCMKIARDLIKTDEVVIDIITKRLARPDAAQIFATKTVDTKALTDQIAKFRGLIRAAEREYDNGEVTGVDLKRRRENLQPKIDALQTALVGANTSRRLDGLMGNPKAREVFESLPLDRQRAVIDTVATVTIKPTTKRGGVFDPELIDVAWRTPD
ncbi:MAG: recombinase family protein [Mycobacterium sp.]|uniref:recombinase family protein n=1 Tax=Mycobacterium sp. TaxID=1785 RepID=UPI003F94ED85